MFSWWLKLELIYRQQTPPHLSFVLEENEYIILIIYSNQDITNRLIPSHAYTVGFKVSTTKL